MLPPDLKSAEAEALLALRSALAADPRGRWTAELRFEGLRLLPVVLRLAGALQGEGTDLALLFADAGATALARRDAGEGGPPIASYAEHRRRSGEGASTPSVLLLVGASPADYEEVEALCAAHGGAVVLLNPTLEDAAVGIGSVARQRRRGFLATWQAAYALIPLAGRALRRAHPAPWELYRLDPDGYRLAATFDTRPDGEAQEAALAASVGASPDGGVGAGLRALGDLIDGLQR
jgi:hypothetical protein